MYRKFYGFTEEPFGMEPNPDFLFLTENHEKILESLREGVRSRKGFMMLTGERGVGKTTLIRHFKSLLGEENRVVELSRNFDTIEEILEVTLRELGFPGGERSKRQMARQLGEYLIQKAAEDKTLVMVIDDAQAFKPEVLEELRLLAGQDPRRPKFLLEIFVGDSGLEEILHSQGLRQLGQRISVKRTLEPLTEMESRRYIENRLARAGSEGSKIFTPEALDLLCLQGRGIPRVINRIGYLALSAGYAFSRKKIDSQGVADIVSMLGRRGPDGRPRRESSIRARIEAFGRSSLIVKISCGLLAYSLVSGILLYLLSRK